MAPSHAAKHISVDLVEVSEVGRSVDVGLAHARSHEIADGAEARNVVAILYEADEVFEGVGELRLYQLRLLHEPQRLE